MKFENDFSREDRTIFFAIIAILPALDIESLDRVTYDCTRVNV